MVRLPEALRDAIFLDVELDGDGAIAPVHGVVQFVDGLHDRCRPIVGQVPVLGDAWATLSPIWPDPVIFGNGIKVAIVIFRILDALDVNVVKLGPYRLPLSKPEFEDFA